MTGRSAVLNRYRQAYDAGVGFQLLEAPEIAASLRMVHIQESRKPVHTGGCQCGAVRFAVYMEPRKIGLCHCRMCQKAAGAPFTVLAEVPWGDFAWTRGTPAAFRSSSRSARDFCGECGTPLSYREVGGPIIELMTGAFDDPARVPPTYEVGTESQLRWVDHIGTMPGKTTLENTGPAKLATIESYQHPDRDAGPDWTPRRAPT